MGSLGRVGLRKVAATGGEVNSGVNVGVGVGKVFKDKPALDLRFRSILAGAGITINNLTDEIEIVAAGGSGSYNLARLEGALISTNRAALNWLDSSEIDFSVVDDGASDETEITASIVAASIALAKLANINTNRLLGRQTAAAGPIEEINLNTTLELVAGQILQRAELTGDVTSPAGANVLTYSPFSIANTDINGAAAIELSKLESLTTLRALESNISGQIIASAVTNTELNLLAGATTLELQANKDQNSGYAGLDANARLLLARLPIGSAFQRYRTNSGATAAELFTEEAALEFVIGDGTAVITTGIKIFLRVPFDCDITRWTVMSKDASTSIVLDVNKYTSLANYDAGTKVSIVGSDPPDLVADKSDESTALTGWTTVLNQGDILEIEVDSITIGTRVTLSLRLNKRG